MRHMSKAAIGLFILSSIALPLGGLANPPPPPPCTGNPVCFATDSNGNWVVCGPSGLCIPLETSAPPLQD